MSIFTPSTCKHWVLYIQLPVPSQIVHYCQDNLGYFIPGWFLKNNIHSEICAKSNLVPCFGVKPYLANETQRTTQCKTALSNLT